MQAVGEGFESPWIHLARRKFISIDLALDGKLVPTRIISFNSGDASDCGKMHTMKDVILEVLG